MNTQTKKIWFPSLSPSSLLHILRALRSPLSQKIFSCPTILTSQKLPLILQIGNLLKGGWDQSLTKCDHLKANGEPPGEGGWAVQNVKFRFCQCSKEQVPAKRESSLVLVGQSWRTVGCWCKEDLSASRLCVNIYWPCTIKNCSYKFTQKF